MSRSGILAAGNWILDFVKIIDQYPNQDALANIISESSSNGGSPYNLLKDLAKLKANFPLQGLGLVGSDANGELIKKDCINHQIDIKNIYQTNLASTSYTDVMTVKSTGRRTFFHQRGSNSLLDQSHFNSIDSNAKIFHLGYLLLLDKLDQIDNNGRTVASYIFEEMKQKGFSTSTDIVSESSDRFAKIVNPSLPFVDYLFVNEYEAEKITGAQIIIEDKVDITFAINAASKLIDLGVKKWVVLHFPNGALAVDKDKNFVLQGSVQFPKELIKGASGAGDAFAAGVLFGLHENWDMDQCLKLGVCTAASSLIHPSCSESILPHNEALLLGDKFGYRDITNN